MILEAVGKVTNDFGNQGPIVNLLNSVCIFSIERTYFIFSPSLADFQESKRSMSPVYGFIGNFPLLAELVATANDAGTKRNHTEPFSQLDSSGDA